MLNYYSLPTEVGTVSVSYSTGYDLQVRLTDFPL